MTLTSQLTTTQLGDLQVVDGALHCSGAPGPVVTSQRSERGPNYPHKRTTTILTKNKLKKFILKLGIVREDSKHAAKKHKQSPSVIDRSDLTVFLTPALFAALSRKL